MSSKSSKSSKKGRPSKKASKKAKSPKLTCQCCQRSVSRDAIPFCLSKMEQHSCLQCDKDVCPKCLKRGLCYICRLKNNEGTNSETALKKLKKDSLKAILKRLGMKSADLRSATDEQMIRQIIKRCALDGNVRSSQASTSSSFKQDKDGSQAARPFEVADPEATSSIKEVPKDQTQSHTKPTGLFPLIGNIQNEDQIRQMTIPQLKSFLQYYGKHDASLNEKREFQEVAINFWRTEMKIPIPDDSNRKQKEHQQQHQEQTVEIHGNHEGPAPNEPLSVAQKRESFTLPAEGQAGIPTVGETVHQEPVFAVPPLERINGEAEIQSWSTKQLKAFLEQYGRYNKTWLEKNTLQYEAIRTWRTEMKKQQQVGQEAAPQEPIESSEAQPNISITALPPLEQDGSDSDGSADSESDSDDDRRKNQKLASFRPSYQNQENPEAMPKAVLTEIPVRRDDEDDRHPALGGKLSLRMEDFQDYDNLEAFMGLTNGGGREDLYVANHTAAEFTEMASESMETSDSFVYLQTPKEAVQRPESLSLKMPAKKVGFHPVPEQISDSDTESESYAPAREFAEDSGGSLDALQGPSAFEGPLSPEEFFDTLRDMEDSMRDSSEVPDFTQAVRKRLSSDRLSDLPAPWSDQDQDQDQNQNGMHTPEEFLGAVYSLRADLGGSEMADSRDADMSVAAQRLSAFADSTSGSGKFKEAETESGQSGAAIDIPLIETSDAQVAKMLKTKAQRPESWGVSMDEILAEENIETMKEHHLQLLLQKHGIDAGSWDRPKMVRRVTRLWLMDKQNRISIYEDAIAEGDGSSSDESDGKISPETEFALSLLPPLPPPPMSDPQIVQVIMKDESNEDVRDEVIKEYAKDDSIKEVKDEVAKDNSIKEVKDEDAKDDNIKEVKDEVAKDNSIKEVKDEDAKDDNIKEVKDEVAKEVKYNVYNNEVQKPDHYYTVDMDRIKRLAETIPVDKVPVQHSLNESDILRKKKPEVPKKPAVPPPPTRSTKLGRTPSTSAYLTFIMSEEEIENLEEYKLRAILRTAKVSMKDIWKRDDLIEEVAKVWRKDQLDRGRSLERALSSSGFGAMNRSRKSSTESLQQDIDLDSIETEKDLERLTSRNLQNYLIKHGVSIQGLLLRDHFLREAKKHLKSLNAANADDEPQQTKVKERERAEVHLEEILSEKEIEFMSVEAIKALLKKHGSVVDLEDQKPDLVARLQLLWRRKTANTEGHNETAPSALRTEVTTVYEEVIHEVESKEVHLNNGVSVHIETHSVGREGSDEVDAEDAGQIEVLHGPPKPQRVSKIETLEDITSPEVIRKMDTKKMKALLTKYSVSFADCQEKHEIVQRLETLWHDNKKYESQEVQPEELCKICMSERADCVLLECGHVTTCTECGHKITECPVCRNYVAKVVRLYKS